MHWLDKSRLIFPEWILEDGSLYAGALSVVTPQNGQLIRWRASVNSWAVSPQNDEIWALVSEGKQGNLYRTSAQKPRWTSVKRDVWKDKRVAQEAEAKSPDIRLSPSGELIALNYNAAVELLETAGGHTWRWENSIDANNKGIVRFLGWAKGQKFPLLSYFIPM